MLKVTGLHRIVESFALEDTLKDHLVQPSCNKQGHLQLHQSAQSPNQPQLGYLREQGIYLFPMAPPAMLLPCHPEAKQPLARGRLQRPDTA